MENLPNTSSLTEYEQRYWKAVLSKKGQEKQENNNLPAKLQLNSLVVGQSLELPSAKDFRQVCKMSLQEIATSNFTSLGKYQKQKKDLGKHLAGAAVYITYLSWGEKIPEALSLDLGDQIADEFPTISPEQVFFVLDNIPTKKFKLTPKVIIEALREFRETKEDVAAKVSLERHAQNKFYQSSETLAAKEVEKELHRQAQIFNLQSKINDNNNEE